MKWLYKLDRKFGKFSIPNLMMIIIIGQGMIFLAELLNPSVGISNMLSLVWPAVLRGQVWRLFTFIFVPSTYQVIGLLLTLYLYYMIGHTLENEWGDFKFNVYYLCGMLGAILAAAVTGYGVNIYINLSLFLAYSMLYPEHQILLFFVIPVKMKYLAYMAGVYYILMILVGNWSTKASIILSLINFFIFFGPDFIKYVRQEMKYHKTRQAWRNNNNNNNNNRW